MEQAEPQQGVQNNNNAGAGGGGVPIEQWYFELPIITRIYATGAVLTTLLCQLNVISPFHLYFSFRQIVYNKQYWRLFTNFFFFGSFGLDFIFYIFFLVRYCRMLEEGSFRGRSADFAWMLILGALFLTGAAPFVHLLFLGSSLTFMMVYVWARRNPDVRMNFLGVLNFNAPYLPWVLLGFSCFLNSTIPVSDGLGIIIGHIYYFMDDVYPITSRTGKRYLRSPAWFRRLFESGAVDDAVPNLDQVQEGDHPHEE